MFLELKNDCFKFPMQKYYTYNRVIVIEHLVFSLEYLEPVSFCFKIMHLNRKYSQSPSVAIYHFTHLVKNTTIILTCFKKTKTKTKKEQKEFPWVFMPHECSVQMC